MFVCFLYLCVFHLQGTLSSRGKVILMADADGATKFSDLDKVEAGLRDLNPKPVWLCLVMCSSKIHLLLEGS